MAVNDHTFRAPFTGTSPSTLLAADASNRRYSTAYKPALLPLPTSPLQRQMCVRGGGEHMSPLALSRGSSCMNESESAENTFRRELEFYRRSLEKRIKSLETDSDTRNKYEKELVHQKRKADAVDTLWRLL